MTERIHRCWRCGKRWLTFGFASFDRRCPFCHETAISFRTAD